MFEGKQNNILKVLLHKQNQLNILEGGRIGIIKIKHWAAELITQHDSRPSYEVANSEKIPV